MGASKIARDISEQQALARQKAFLAETGAVLASSLDYQSTLNAVAKLAVPAVADWCAVDVVHSAQIDRLAVAHVDPANCASQWSSTRAPHQFRETLNGFTRWSGTSSRMR